MGEKLMVVKLIKALYGHPQAGAFWEQRCERALKNAGFKTLGDCGEWRSVYYHPIHQTLLMVYVDDFKMSGPVKGMAASWEAIKAQTEYNKESCKTEQAIKLGDVEDVNHFLGCDHAVSETVNEDGTKSRLMTYSKHQFMRQCLERYHEVVGPEYKLEERDTPFVDEDDHPNPARLPNYGINGEIDGLVCPHCTEAFAVTEFTPVANPTRPVK